MPAFAYPSPIPCCGVAGNAHHLVAQPAPLLRCTRQSTRAHRPRQPRSPVVECMSSFSMSGAGKDAPGPGLADRIARAFVAACTPSDAPYAEQLAHFCREALHAYKTGYSLVALQLEMAGATTGVGRALASDEVELRSVWLALVFKTLRQIHFPATGVGAGQRPSGSTDNGTTWSAATRSIGPAEGFEKDRLDDFVRNIVGAAKKGYDLKRIQLEQTLTSSESTEKPRTLLENAILNQSTRIVLTTLKVAGEQSGKP